MLKGRPKFWKNTTEQKYKAAISQKKIEIIWKCAIGFSIPGNNFENPKNYFPTHTFWDIARNFSFFGKKPNYAKK